MPPPTYLVQYGRSAFVGRFAAPDGVYPSRGDRVVVRTPRGLEIGEALCEAAEPFADTLDPAAGGTLLRVATLADDTAAAARDRDAHALLADAEALAAGLPLTFLDAEVTLDGTAAVLHAVPWGECDADPLFAALSDRTGRPVRMLDVSRTPVVADPPPPATGCGKPDCGSGSGGCSTSGSGGGCSTGGCSRGKVKSADELTAYFADLRQKMEAHASGRTPLA